MSWLASRAFSELEAVGKGIEAHVAGIARRYRLSHAALNALAFIEGSGGPLPAGEVSARMHVTSGTMTAVLDTLERNGYCKRIADPGDRRRVLVEVTPAAQAILDQVLPEIQQISAVVMSPLGDRTLDGLLHTLAAVREAVAALPDDLPPPPARVTPARLRRT